MRGTARGGGIYGGAGLTLVNCTVVNNGADPERRYSYGGGLHADGAGEPIIRNSIFANNTALEGPYGPNIYGTVQSADFNLIEDDGGVTLNGVTTHNIEDQDPVLAPLADNGGQTWTHALQADSPAIDAGSCTDVVGHGIAADQRGKVRPQGPGCDIGAYEFPGLHLTLAKNVNSPFPQPGEEIEYTIEVENLGDADATGCIISDTLPSGLSLAGSIILEPSSAGTVNGLPTLVTDLTVGAGEQVAVTVPVLVDGSLSPSTRITNTATITGDGISNIVMDSQSITVAEQAYDVYIPLVMRGSH